MLDKNLQVNDQVHLCLMKMYFGDNNQNMIPYQCGYILWLRHILTTDDVSQRLITPQGRDYDFTICERNF